MIGLLLGEKYIVGSAQGRRRFVRIISSCPAAVEIFLDRADTTEGEEEEYITTLPAVEGEFERQHNVFHGDVGDTFNAYVPQSEKYQQSLRRRTASGGAATGASGGGWASSYHVHQHFIIPPDEQEGDRDEEAVILLHEFHITCDMMVLVGTKPHEFNLL